MPVPRAILVTSLMTYWYPGVQETIQLLRQVFPEAPILLGGIYASLLPEHTKKLCGANEVLLGPGRPFLGRLFTGKQGSASALLKIRLSLNSAPVWI